LENAKRFKVGQGDERKEEMAAKVESDCVEIGDH